MWTRGNQILAGILALQVVIAIVVFWPRGTVSGSPAAPLLADFKTDEVVGLTITDRDGNTVELAKNGQDWVLPQREQYPAVSTRVTDLLTKLARIRTNRLIAQTEGSHRALQVAADDFNRKIELKMKDGSTRTVYLGTSGGGGATHVRADAQKEVYLTSEVLSWDVNATESNWVETLYFTVPQTATLSITLQNAQGTFEFERPTGEGEWTMKGLAADEKLEQNSVQDLLFQVTSVRMIGPLGRSEREEYGLAKPQAVVTLRTKEGEQEKRYTLTLGAKLEEARKASGESGEEKQYYYVLRSSESPYFVRVSEYLGNTLANKQRADFLAAPPTPTPTPTATALPSGAEQPLTPPD
ncbi:MAG: DUF4340 domain-containing protein [Anaerolineae bacterium]|nr:DUF4340 domain-containing protein [Anaerolineae bacterium]MDW8070670.1 DUF4340 domain-containing protein [Anaerolineae bacterium]